MSWVTLTLLNPKFLVQMLAMLEQELYYFRANNEKKESWSFIVNHCQPVSTTTVSLGGSYWQL